jgi:hypothetical protein
MNCQAAQRRMFAALDSQRTSDEVRAHLAYCGECRDLQALLVRTERQVPCLPVPRSRAGERFIRKFLEDSEPPPESERPRQAPSTRDSDHATSSAGLEWARVQAKSLAATAAMFSVCSLAGWWLQATAEVQPLPPLTNQPIPQPLGDLAHHDRRLAAATTAGARVEILADLADELHESILGRIDESGLDHLAALVRLYDRVVRDGIVAQARAVPAPELGVIVHSVGNRLALASRQARDILQGMSCPKFSAVSRLAASALEAQLSLQALEQELPS